MSPIDPLQDGIDHINVYSKGHTPLGRALTNFSAIGFTLPQEGMFASMEGYWYWLATGQCHDKLRRFTGYQAKAYGRDYPRVEVPDFQSRILKAHDVRLDQNSRLWWALVTLKLPLLHYYVYGSVPGKQKIIDKSSDFQIQHLNRRRGEFQNPDATPEIFL